jgi:hypothetical protein
MIDGQFSEGYPKDYENVTRENIDGYPKYRRCDGKNTKLGTLL